jgi:beta-N-acetylhexosaminidase
VAKSLHTKELSLTVEQLCGQLIVGGFPGHELPAAYAEALSRGERAGAIVFSRNIGDMKQVAALNRSIIAASPDASPPFIALDQEGGRVRRLKAPFIELPPMRVLGHIDDLELTHQAAELVAQELGAVGFNINFAPVMDVDSNPLNPVIGDRSFGRDARTVAKHGVAFLRGLQTAHVLACAKHFPGHGDTATDSHLELPAVSHDEKRLAQVELPPFRAASGAGVAAMMTAHVVYDGLDPGVPATFSRAICASLLRNQMGFEGVLFCDDLEMGAIADNWGIEHAACESIWAGCDVLLVCSDIDKQSRAHAALVERARQDERVLQGWQQAAERSLKLRKLCPPRVLEDEQLEQRIGGARARTLMDRIEQARAAIAAAPDAPPSGDRLSGDLLSGDRSTDPTERET